MNHFKKIAGVLEAHGLDAVLLTCEEIGRAHV